VEATYCGIHAGCMTLFPIIYEKCPLCSRHKESADNTMILVPRTTRETNLKKHEIYETIGFLFVLYYYYSRR
jgi:hypothetical protein